MEYERTEAGGYRCLTHNVAFGLGEVCRQCTAVSTTLLSEADPAQGRSDETAEHEAWLLEGRDRLIALAEQMTEERDERGAIDRAGYSTVCKFYGEALKYERTYLEEKAKRDAVEHDRDLMRHERQMSGLRGRH